MKALIDGFTAMTGGNVIGFMALGGVILFGVGHLNGVRVEKNAQAVREAKAEKKLDGISTEVQLDTSKIASELSEKIDVRADTRGAIDLENIKQLARIEGELAGKVAGYKKGFEDAENIPNTCINDPKFLSDSMRLGAISRYEAIFGSANTP